MRVWRIQIQTWYTAMPCLPMTRGAAHCLIYSVVAPVHRILSYLYSQSIGIYDSESLTSTMIKGSKVKEKRAELASTTLASTCSSQTAQCMSAGSASLFMLAIAAIDVAIVLRMYLISSHLPPQNKTPLNIYRIPRLEAGLERLYHLTW